MRLKLTKKPEAIEAQIVDARRRSYPPLAEFADAFYWSQRGNAAPMEAYLAKVDAVKAKNPTLK